LCNDGNLYHHCVITSFTVPPISPPRETNVLLHNILAFSGQTALTVLTNALEQLLLAIGMDVVMHVKALQLGNV